MNDDPDDDSVARVLTALADPRALRLLEHVLHDGPCDSAVGLRLGMTAALASAHLERLVAAGLLTRSAPGSPVYRVGDVADVERLLLTVRRLGAQARRVSDAALAGPSTGRGQPPFEPSPLGHATGRVRRSAPADPDPSQGAS